MCSTRARRFPQRHDRGVAVEKWTSREDERLLTGKGRYVADIRVPGCLDAAFVRSDVAHGVLREVDCTAARAVPGVVGAWSAGDLPELPPSAGPSRARGAGWPGRSAPPAPNTGLYHGRHGARIAAAPPARPGTAPEGRNRASTDRDSPRGPESRDHDPGQPPRAGIAGDPAVPPYAAAVSRRDTAR
ncbi:hypothetical protein [Streptomyces sp. NPDC093261]|uniref:hypothetical protein n=1 Tax=Streptomyces sp. NPDC093261 TaxID=3366037 RepID=UPI003817ADB6